MKRTIAFCAIVALAACSTVPSGQQVFAIQNACAVDAGLRPAVNVLIATPGLVPADDVAALIAARAVIDPICSNPSGPFEANALAALTIATSEIVAITSRATK